MTQIQTDIINIGVNDHQTQLFESQFPIPHGMAYNSYLIRDDKTVVIDTVERHFSGEWLSQLRQALEERSPDYLLVQHMEPDHSAAIAEFMDSYPQSQLVCSAAALTMIRQFFDRDFSARARIVKEGDTLELGKRSLRFIAAPMVHWPEVIMSYCAQDRILFSADAFGKFGATDEKTEESWDDEARRFYIGIVAKYGVQVQAVLKKAATLDIQTICATHGPVLSGDLSHYIDLYTKWSSYTPETDGILIAYTSVYGHTEAAVLELAKGLEQAGRRDVCVMNLALCDMAEAVAQAFKRSKLVLATTTYNTEIFPFMHTFLHKLAERNFCKRSVGLIENGSWAPLAAKVMKEQLSRCKDIQILEPVVTIKSALNEASRQQLAALCKAL